MRQNKHKIILVFAFTAFIFGLLALQEAGDVNWHELWHKIYVATFLLSDHVLPCFVLAGTLISWRKAYRTGVALAAFGLVTGIVAVPAYYMRGASGESSAPIIVNILSNISLPFCVITITLLFVQRLSGRADRIRKLGMGLLAAFYLAYFATSLFPALFVPFWMYDGRVILGAAAFLTVSWVSWAIPFYAPAKRNGAEADVEASE